MTIERWGKWKNVREIHSFYMAEKMMYKLLHQLVGESKSYGDTTNQEERESRGKVKI
jgi:hypothetical protein